jgi:hypothetical protein
VLLHVPWPQEVLLDFSTSSSIGGGISSGGDSSSSSSSLGSSLAAAAAAASLSVNKDVDAKNTLNPCLGPCLRMGLAEGQPHSIMPDHLVRAFANFGCRTVVLWWSAECLLLYSRAS